MNTRLATVDKPLFRVIRCCVCFACNPCFIAAEIGVPRPLLLLLLSLLLPLSIAVAESGDELTDGSQIGLA